MGLAEAFSLNEDFLFTALGKEDKNPYEALMEDAKENNPLNKAEVHPGFMKYIKPIMGPKL